MFLYSDPSIEKVESCFITLKIERESEPNRTTSCILDILAWSSFHISRRLETHMFTKTEGKRGVSKREAFQGSGNCLRS